MAPLAIWAGVENPSCVLVWVVGRAGDCRSGLWLSGLTASATCWTTRRNSRRSSSSWVGQAGITDAFFATTMGILALIATAYAIRAVLRLRVEEEGLRGRPRFSLPPPPGSDGVRSHLLYAVVGPVLMLALAAAASGAHVRDHRRRPPPAAVPTVVEASLDTAPGTVGRGRPWRSPLFGLSAALTSVSWGVLVACLLLGQLGQILQFPQWALNLSPFSHIPQVPRGRLRACTPGDPHCPRDLFPRRVRVGRLSKAGRTRLEAESDARAVDGSRDRRRAYGCQESIRRQPAIRHAADVPQRPVILVGGRNFSCGWRILSG